MEDGKTAFMTSRSGLQTPTGHLQASSAGPQWHEPPKRWLLVAILLLGLKTPFTALT